MDMEGTDVKRVFVNRGSSLNILYKDVLYKLDVDKSRLKPTRMPLSGFTRDKVEAEGTIKLVVEFGAYPMY